MILKLFIVSLGISTSAFAASTDLKCTGSYKWPQDGTEKITLTAKIEDQGVLKKINEVRVDPNGETTTLEYRILRPDVNFDPDPATSKYYGYNRYKLKGGAGWTNYRLLLPKGLDTKALVAGYQQRTGHDSSPTIDLKCQVIAGELKEAVAQDIEALAWDTVNEGSQTATVIYKRKEPAVDCKISNNKKEAGKYWAFCSVGFKVEFEYSEDKAERTCDLLYSYNPTDIQSLVADEDKEMECLMYLGEGE